MFFILFEYVNIVVTLSYIRHNLSGLRRIRTIDDFPLDNGFDLVPCDFSAIRVGDIQIELLAVWRCNI